MNITLIAALIASLLLFNASLAKGRALSGTVGLVQPLGVLEVGGIGFAEILAEHIAGKPEHIADFRVVRPSLLVRVFGGRRLARRETLVARGCGGTPVREHDVVVRVAQFLLT